MFRITSPIPRTAILVDLVASQTKCYIGDQLSLQVRVRATQAVSNLSLRLSLPEGFRNTHAICHSDDSLPSTQVTDTGQDLVWNHSAKIAAGAEYLYHIHVNVAHLTQPTTLSSVAQGRAVVQGGGTIRTADTASIQVRPKSDYLQHLPGLYYDDDFMGRFLMLFESFWQPVDQQINSLPAYFDAKITPGDFLPWLASWLNLVLDERWPEDRRRLLLTSAAYLYRTRGTKIGLQRFLEIYTGEKADIVEHRANNLRLGEHARLGEGIALGRRNQPHTFSVTLRLPPIDPQLNQASRNRLAKDRERIIEGIIESEKPAHTRYSLTLEEK